MDGASQLNNLVSTILDSLVIHISCDMSPASLIISIQNPVVYLLTLFLRSCFSSCPCSPCSGEGEGLHPAPGQLLVIRQQPVHQSQRQRRVGVRRRLRLELRVWGRGAAQQEEAACWGQLEKPSGSNLAMIEAVGHKGGREGTQPSKLSRLIHPFPLCDDHQPRPPSHHRPLASISGWARTGDTWRLKPPHNRLFSHPISTNWREEVSRVEDDCFNPSRELQVFPPLPIPLFRSFLWFSVIGISPPSNANNPKPKKRQLGYLRTWCFFCTLNKAPPPPRVVFGGEGRVRRTPPSTAILYIFCFFSFCLFCYSW